MKKGFWPLLIFVLVLGVFNRDALTKNMARTEQNPPDPGLRSRMYRHPHATLFQEAEQVIAALPRWRLIKQDADSGTILAERRTRLFRFVDDIEIQVTAIDSGASEVNLVSRSRVGKGDFGQNRRNILEFLNLLESRMNGKRSVLSEVAFNDLPGRLMGHVDHLAGDIGARHFARPEALSRAADYVFKSFEQSGYQPVVQEFGVDPIPLATRIRATEGEQGRIKAVRFRNIIATLPGREKEAIVVGAHYDTVRGTHGSGTPGSEPHGAETPGADDNASGVAALIEIARLMRTAQTLRQVCLNKTLIFVGFANEEPPFSRTDAMGSAHFVAEALKAKEKITFMISLEMLGFYSDLPHSQTYPLFLKWFYPDQANFIAVVGNISSRSYVTRVTQSFRSATGAARVANPAGPAGAAGPAMPLGVSVESLVAPRFVRGVDFSDHMSFWDQGIPAVMITDTAFFRNPNYHRSGDRPETLQYDRMAGVVQGVVSALIELAGC